MNEITVLKLADKLQQDADFFLGLKEKVLRLTDGQLLELTTCFAAIEDNFLVTEVCKELVSQDLKDKIIVLNDEQFEILMDAINDNDEAGNGMSMSEVVNFIDDEDLVIKVGNLSDEELAELVETSFLVTGDDPYVDKLINMVEDESLAEELDKFTDGELLALIGEEMDLEDPEE